MFMCRGHWSRLPTPVQRAIYREYRPGQEKDKKPSTAYLAVQQWAIALVAFRPNDEQAAATSAKYILGAAVCRTLAMSEGALDPLRGLVPKGTKMPDITIEQARAMIQGETPT